MDVTCSFSYDEVNTIKNEDRYINAKQIPLFILDTDKMKQYKYIAENRSDIIFVAGFSHTPNVDGAIWFVNKVFPKIKHHLPDIKIYLVGSKPTKSILDMQSEDIIVTGFVTDEELENIYSKAKLIVCPLRYGAGVKGKIIEAVYHKVPVITTNIGIEGINNESALIDVKDSPDEFAQCVIDRYNDNTWLEQQTSKFPDWIEEHFSEQAVRNGLKEYIKFTKNGEKTA
jgi:glycosyltransferase involved in cell wall biosynthesis